MKNNSLALGGLFACLHVVFLLFSKVLVGSELLLVLFLPLFSTIYTIRSDKKNIVMFLIATMLVCSIFDVIGTFIYVFPALVCGVLYGYLRKRQVKELELLYITGFGHMVTLTISFCVIAFLFKEIDFMQIFASIFSFNGTKLLVITFCFLFILGFCEAFLVHVISDKELEKFVSKVKKNEAVPKWFIIGVIISSISFIILYAIDSIWMIISLLTLIIFILPFIIFGMINVKYKIITFVLIFIFSLFSIFIIKYINPICYFGLPELILSPFIINNFEYIKEKNF